MLPACVQRRPAAGIAGSALMKERPNFLWCFHSLLVFGKTKEMELITFLVDGSNPPSPLPHPSLPNPPNKLL